MEEKELKKIKKQLDCLNDENKFEEAIELIKTLPEEERDLEIKVRYAQMLNNIAMVTLGEFHQDTEAYIPSEDDNENSPKIPYIQEAIHRLENIKEEGQNHCTWNKRMANAYYSMGHVLEDQSTYYYSLALPYFKKYLALESQSKKHEALKMLDECIENLADRYLAQKNYLKGFQLIDELSTGWKNYSPYLLVTGIKEQEEKEIDEYISKKLDELAEMGNDFEDKGDEGGALKAWQEALNIIPYPKDVHLESIWFEASMGEIYFSQCQFNKATILYNSALINQCDTRLDSHILMRLGECQYELGNKKFAKRLLLQAYELDREEVFRRDEVNLKYLDFLLEELKKDEEARRHPFKDFDFTGFWNDSEYALNKYVSEAPTDELIAEIEKELGYKLPASYIHLMKIHNGGIPVNTYYPIDSTSYWTQGYVEISGIFGIGRDKMYSLCGEFGSNFMIYEWEYPPIGVAICNTPTGGHDMIFLDYSYCGHDGEPSVVHVDQENDFKIIYLAENFEEFIRGLVYVDDFEDDEDFE